MTARAVELERKKTGEAMRNGFPLAAAVLAAVAAGLFYLSSVLDGRAANLLWLSAFAPVVLAASHREDPRPGLAYAAFFAAALIWRASWASVTGAEAVSIVSALAASTLLLAAAHVASGLAGSFGTREALAGAVVTHQALLERVGSLDAVSGFVAGEARRAIQADEAGLLVRDPVEGCWQFAGEKAGGQSERARCGALPWNTKPNEPELWLGDWLAEKTAGEVVDDLRRDPRFRNIGSLRSLLVHPLGNVDGSPMAVLALASRRPGAFAPMDCARLTPLLDVAQFALGHAGAYERAGRVGDRLARQLAAIQRTARELNTARDPAVIANRALLCAMEITEASAGAICVTGVNGELIEQVAGARLTQSSRALLAQASALSSASYADPRAPRAEGLLQDAETRLLAPVPGDGSACGGILLEHLLPDAFDAQDAQAITALASHGGIALANARLLADLKREREKSERVIRAMGDGLMTVDADARIQMLNPAAEAFIGRPLSQVVGQSACEVLGCAEREACAGKCRMNSALEQLEPWVDNRQTRAPDGASRVLQVSAAPLRQNGHQGGAVLLLRDVTTQAELAQFQRELLSTFSHELRAPLSNIVAVVDLLEQQGEEADAEDCLPSEFLQTLRAQSQRLSNMAERTLDVARLDAGTWSLAPRPIAVGAIARDAAMRSQANHPEMPVRLVLSPRPIWVLADEEAAGLILDNLLDNAAKYAPTAEGVTLKVEVAARFATLAVEDRGMPLPPAECERLFERFYRRDRTDARKTYGVGFGLYIVRKLSRTMGGEAWAEPLGEVGNRFAFKVPIVEEPS